MMKMKKAYFMFPVLILFLTMVLPAGAAQASSKQFEVTGQITLSVVPNSFVEERVVGSKDAVNWEDSIVIGTFLFDVAYSGDITGTGLEIEHGRWNFKLDKIPHTKVLSNSDGIQQFSGSILGRSGTFTARTRHQCYDGRVRVEQTILSGTGDLTGLHGTLIFDVYPIGNLTHQGVYSGKLHWAP